MVQLVIGFIIPTIVLMTLSDSSRLGPFWAMCLALFPPVALEIYSFLTGRKASLLSLFAIIGILLIGIISLLGLSEEWLGVRRAGIYIIAAIGIAGVLSFKRDWIDKGLGKVIDMQAVRKAAKEKDADKEVAKLILKVGYMVAGFLLIIGIWSYILTLIVMNAPTGSSEFNAQYGELRILSIPFISLPLLLGISALLVYLTVGFEKITGIDIEKLLKKNERPKRR